MYSTSQKFLHLSFRLESPFNLLRVFVRSANVKSSVTCESVLCRDDVGVGIATWKIFSPSYKIVSCIYLPRSISRSLRRRSSLFVVAIAAATAAVAAAATAVVIVAHAVRRRYCSCNRRLVARGF